MNISLFVENLLIYITSRTQRVATRAVQRVIKKLYAWVARKKKEKWGTNRNHPKKPNYTLHVSNSRG